MKTKKNIIEVNNSSWKKLKLFFYDGENGDFYRCACRICGKFIGKMLTSQNSDCPHCGVDLYNG